MSPQRNLDFWQMEGSVFLFGGNPAESLFIFAILWSPVASFIPFVGTDPLYWFLVTLLVGFIFHMVYYQVIILRYRDPVTGGEILDVLDRARSDVGAGEDVQIWRRESDRLIFSSRATIRYKVILMSPSAVADILARPDKGRVVLAQRILMMEKARPFSRFLEGVLLFAGIAGVSLGFLTDFITFVSASALSVIIMATIALGLLVLVVIPLIKSMGMEDVNDALTRIYGPTANAAMVEVFQGIDIPEDVVREAIKESEEERPVIAAKARKNGLIAAGITFPIASMIFVLIVGVERFLVLVPWSLFILVFSAAFAGVMFWGASSMTKINVRYSSSKRARDTSSDYRDEYTQSVQELLNREPRYEHLVVRGVKLSGRGTEGLVVIDEMGEPDETTLIGILPDMLSLLRDPDLVAPYIIAEIERYQIDKKERRYGWIFVGLAFAFLIPGALWGFLTYGLLEGTFVMLQVLIAYVLICTVGFGISYYWKKSKTVEADVAVATKYPRFREALHVLVTNHYTQPFGITSFRTRLDRINEKMGTPRFTPSPDAGIDLQ